MIIDNTINPGQILDPMFDTKLSWCPRIKDSVLTALKEEVGKHYASLSIKVTADIKNEMLKYTY